MSIQGLRLDREAGRNGPRPTQTKIAQLGSVSIANNSIKATLPSQSITLFVIPAGKITSVPTAPTGLAALRMTTIDQADRLVLDFYRCAMLPLSPGAGPNAAEHADDLSKVGADLIPPPSAIEGWRSRIFTNS